MQRHSGDHINGKTQLVDGYQKLEDGSSKAGRWLEDNPLIQVIFQPLSYSPTTSYAISGRYGRFFHALRFLYLQEYINKICSELTTFAVESPTGCINLPEEVLNYMNKNHAASDSLYVLPV